MDTKHILVRIIYCAVLSLLMVSCDRKPKMLESQEVKAFILMNSIDGNLLSELATEYCDLAISDSIEGMSIPYIQYQTEDGYIENFWYDAMKESLCSWRAVNYAIKSCWGLDRGDIADALCNELWPESYSVDPIGYGEKDDFPKINKGIGYKVMSGFVQYFYEQANQYVEVYDYKLWDNLSTKSFDGYLVIYTVDGDYNVLAGLGINKNEGTYEVEIIEQGKDLHELELTLKYSGDKNQ